MQRDVSTPAAPGALPPRCHHLLPAPRLAAGPPVPRRSGRHRDLLHRTGNVLPHGSRGSVRGHAAGHLRHRQRPDHGRAIRTRCRSASEPGALWRPLHDLLGDAAAYQKASLAAPARVAGFTPRGRRRAAAQRAAAAESAARTPMITMRVSVLVAASARIPALARLFLTTAGAEAVTPARSRPVQRGRLAEPQLRVRAAWRTAASHRACLSSRFGQPINQILIADQGFPRPPLAHAARELRQRALLAAMGARAAPRLLPALDPPRGPERSADPRAPGRIPAGGHGAAFRLVISRRQEDRDAREPRQPVRHDRSPGGEGAVSYLDTGLLAAAVSGSR